MVHDSYFTWKLIDLLDAKKFPPNHPITIQNMDNSAKSIFLEYAELGIIILRIKKGKRSLNNSTCS
jgi:hypothetical protein